MAIRRTTMDFVAKTMTVEMRDGRSETIAMPAGMAADAIEIQRAVFDFATWELSLALPQANVAVELGWPGPRDLPPPGMPIIYLDQLHWVNLARQRFASSKLRDVDREAANTLVQLASNREILLPMSSAHLVETGPSAGPRRAQLATTILDLSRGWQMRNPVEIRARELRASLSGRTPVAAGVFTLEPNVLFAEASAAETSDNELAELGRRLSAITAVYAAMVDPEQIDVTHGRTKAEFWAAAFQRLADWMREHRTSREHTRINARAALLADLQVEIAAACQAVRTGQSEFEVWLTRAGEGGFADMPYLGRAEGVLYHRLRNAEDRWEPNDLFDLNFLCSAAGYADVVVGEKQTIEYLRRIENEVPTGASMCRTLSEVVAWLGA